ncbi:uncharacterized protein LOC117575055 [Drosophila albomicans]|uniref:Uncharacterized protein LOC117575055 n=1 Tax=Drosophila albomicans TaxID=7291 RepID=A0A9C6SZX9_DROAB|nr:uncharacterized protein LOC117575055 [Drosophila albomicans]
MKMRNQHLTGHGLGNARSLLGLIIIFVIWQQCHAMTTSNTPCKRQHTQKDCAIIKAISQGVGDYCNNDNFKCDPRLTCTYSKCWGCIDDICYPDCGRVKRLPPNRLPSWFQRTPLENFAQKYIEPNYDDESTKYASID